MTLMKRHKAFKIYLRIFLAQIRTNYERLSETSSELFVQIAFEQTNIYTFIYTEGFFICHLRGVRGIYNF